MEEVLVLLKYLPDRYQSITEDLVVFAYEYGEKQDEKSRNNLVTVLESFVERIREDCMEDETIREMYN